MKRLSKRQKQSLISSIRHWQRDIKDPLEKGIKVKKMELVHFNMKRYLYFVDYPQKGERTDVPCYRQDCPMCRAYFREGRCTNCPYKLYYGFQCWLRSQRSGHWVAFIEDPNLETCIAMIESMQKILEEDERMARDALGGTGW